MRFIKVAYHRMPGLVFRLSWRLTSILSLQHIYLDLPGYVHEGRQPSFVPSFVVYEVRRVPSYLFKISVRYVEEPCMHAHMLICKFTEITIYEDKPSYKAPS